MRQIRAAVVALCVLTGVNAVCEPVELLPPFPEPANFPHLHSLLHVSPGIYSGAEPENEEAFVDLARLGVKTIVSVDGARPDIAAARRHGLRYVHIPFGYDGVNADAGLAIARVMRECDRPIYFHCHHGTHRGPAAAAVACVASGVADGETALAILTRAGTSRGYAGLWRDVRAYQPPPLDAALPELVEVAEVGSLAAAMAQVDRASDNLKLCQSAGWRSPPDHPDLAPAQEALLLREGLHEMLRQFEGNNSRDNRFLQWMREAEGAAVSLENQIQRGARATLDAQFRALQDHCLRCHVAYRN